MLSIEMLPANYGDCLWIEYGDAKAPNRILIDGGTADTEARLRKRIEAVKGPCHIELFVITHIDIDHIAGALKLLKKMPKNLTIGEVWFNAYRHLPIPDDTLGPKQAEDVSKLLDKMKIPWNSSFGGKAVVVPDEGELPVKTTPGGAKLTLLSPYPAQLATLRDEWETVLPQEGFVVGGGLVDKPGSDEPDDLLGDLDVVELADAKSKADRTAPNGSSIAMLLAVGRKKILLGADAFASTLEKSIKRLRGQSKKPLAINAFKVPHHGSKSNLSTSLLKTLQCKQYLISTNGRKHKHPDREAIARILVHGGEDKVICFNYRSEFNEIWEDDELYQKHGYSTVFPYDGTDGLTCFF